MTAPTPSPEPPPRAAPADVPTTFARAETRDVPSPPATPPAIPDAETRDLPAAARRDLPTGAPTPPAGAPLDLREGARLGGRYELVSLLGRGGMGAVWRARDLAAQRDVALKVVLAHGARDGDRRARFQREGELTASLQHPGIVRVHAAGELDGVPFLAYELVEGGRTLEGVLASPEVPLAHKVALVRDAARALGHAHGQGIFHRDVKPSNILVDAEGRARVADFGLAAATGLERLTQTGAIVGTPTHMSPEQIGANPEPVGPATDVWALGVVLYQALTGALPFRGETLMALGAAIADGRFVAPRDLARDVSAELEAVCVTALAPLPGDRYPDAAALADDLDRCLEGREVSDATLPARARRRRRQVGLAVVAVVATAALVVVGATDSAREARRRVELEQLARDADRLTRRALGGLEPLRRDLDDRRALRARLDALDPAGADARLAASRLRLGALEALAAGDTAALHTLGAAPAAGQVEGLAVLGEGAARLDPGRLEAAIEAGWSRPEVLLLRARAVGRQGVVLDEATARRVLRDLDVAAAADLPLDRLAHVARATAQARLRRVDEAQAALARVPEPPAQAVWAVRLAEVEDGLDRLGLARLLDLLPAGEPPPELVADAARVAARARERARPWLDELARDPDALSVGELTRAVDRVALGARLEPARPIERPVLEALVAAVSSLRRRMPARVVLAVAELAPHDVGVQAHLARFARTENTGAKRTLLPVARRAYALAEDAELRREMGLVLCVVLDGLEVDEKRPAEVDALASELLSDPGLVEPVARGTLHELRHEARRRLGRHEEALEDIDASLRCVPERETLLVDRAQLEADLGDHAAALEDALEYVRRTDWASDAKVPVGALDEATRLVWELGRAQGRSADVRAVLDRYLLARSERWGWSLRAAHLAAEAGDARSAADHVERALHALRSTGDAREQAAFVSAASGAHAALRGGRLADAADTLRRMVDELERARAGKMIP